MVVAEQRLMIFARLPFGDGNRPKSIKSVIHYLKFKKSIQDTNYNVLSAFCMWFRFGQVI